MGIVAAPSCPVDPAATLKGNGHHRSRADSSTPEEGVQCFSKTETADDLRISSSPPLETFTSGEEEEDEGEEELDEFEGVIDDDDEAVVIEGATAVSLQMQQQLTIKEQRSPVGL